MGAVNLQLINGKEDWRSEPMDWSKRTQSSAGELLQQTKKINAGKNSVGAHVGTKKEEHGGSDRALAAGEKQWPGGNRQLQRRFSRTENEARQKLDEGKNRLAQCFLAARSQTMKCSRRS
jgi:hypothetical protein